ncbi:MAG: NAD kinase [Bacteroidales bacterium]|jgi:NAD+ kinase|nr:NAD kinase [Bacteroidales bacterium]MBR4459919.1 NAD kinase [Paludibacteraceae bacterium]MBR4548033.1 NAD kinase [Paludibacteraceae bacterium]
MTIAIFGNSGKRETLSEVKYLLDFMQRHDVRVILSNELRSEMNLREEYPLYTPETDENIHFALSIGGDGTFLTTAMQVAEKGIPILGINCGHLGFLADVQTEEVEPIMHKLISGDFTIEERSMLEVTTSDDAAKRILNPFALNEVAILKQELASMISVEAMLNGEPLHNYYGDGLIISTPTGSTAYNLSAGGPIAVPQSRVLLLSPVASHSLNVRPLVIPDDWKLDLRVHSRTGAFLISIDGRSQRLTEEVTLHVEKAAFSVKLVRIDGHSFINALKTKLSWGI